MLLILGSGLGALGDEVENPVAVPYEESPGGLIAEPHGLRQLLRLFAGRPRGPQGNRSRQVRAIFQGLQQTVKLILTAHRITPFRHGASLNAAMGRRTCAACGAWLAGDYGVPAALFVRQEEGQGERIAQPDPAVNREEP